MSRRALVAIVVSGATLTLAFPEPDLAPLAWVALSPLLALARARSAGRGALLGFLFGLAFFGTLLYWISIVGWLAWALLVVLQAGFLALFGAGWALASRVGWTAGRIVAAASLWVAVEYLRALFPVVGFTWGQLAQSQHNVVWILKAAGLGGSWMVAFVLIAVNALWAEAWSAGASSLRARRLPSRRVPALLGAATLLLLLPAFLPQYGGGGEPLEVAIVQGNVPQTFEGSVYDKELSIIASHEQLTSEIPSGSVDLVVWPESSVGLDARRDPNARAALRRSARSVGVPLVVGANLDKGADNYEVAALHLSPDGETTDIYRKTHLVPFGEYVPARDALDWLPLLDQVPRDAVPGKEKTLFDLDGNKIAPVISFEGDFGSLVRERIGGGGRLLIVATNTSTWGNSWASAQHVAMSQVRAAENGVGVIHAAISGISAFVAPDGSISARTPLWTATTLTGEVEFSEQVSLYARTGDWLAVLSVISGVGLALAGFVGSRARAKERKGRG